MRKPGDWIHGKYQVERVLGAGGMGTVYATKRRNQSHAAVKILHPRFARDKAIRARFVEEGYLANRVDHPAVVTILEDDIDEEGNFYLVMELLDGVDLGRFVGPPRSAVTTAQALQIANQLLLALEEAHKRGIVHRDIKPANVMILRDGRVKLLDFGIAKALGADATLEEEEDDDEQEDDEEQEESSARPHLVLGTDKYMSPEQGKGFLEAIDARTDLWSVGAMLLSLLANEEPNETPLWDQSYEERAWAFSRLGQDVPPHVVQIISLALQPQKAKRWASAKSMREAVQTAHLDLFGSFKRESLAELAATHLSVSPDLSAREGALADTSLSEKPLAIDRTSVSRGTQPPVATNQDKTSTRSSTRKSTTPTWISPRALVAFAFALACVTGGIIWILRPLSQVDDTRLIDPESTPPIESVASPQENAEEDAPSIQKQREKDQRKEEVSLSGDPIRPRKDASGEEDRSPPIPRSNAKLHPSPKNDSEASGGAPSNVGSTPVPDSASNKRCDGLEGIFAIENCP